MHTREELILKPRKELLVIAKELEIKGRTTMKTPVLIDAILESYPEHPEAVKGLSVHGVFEDEAKDYENDNALVILGVLPKKNKKLGLEEELAATVEVKTEAWEQPTIFDSAPIDKTIPKNRHSYIDEAKIGMLVAFKVNEEKVISGKIDEIHSNKFMITTKNGVRFTVLRKDIIWVKTTDRWPKGVYLALKGVLGPNENRRTN